MYSDVMVILAILFIVISGVAAGTAEIKGDFTQTAEIPSQQYAVYHIHPVDKNKILDITVKTNRSVDFYLLTSKEYDEYISPTSLSFHYEIAEENTTSFHWRGNGDYYLVIDNMEYTVSGAKGDYPVNYTITSKVESKGMSDYLWEYAGGIFCMSVIIVAVVVGYWMHKKPKLEEVLKK